MVPRFVLLAALLCGVAHGQPSGGLLPKAAVAPTYPPIAAAARVSGTVVVKVALDDSGGVISEAVVSGHPLLRKAATEAARKWRFDSASSRRRTVKVYFRFVLSPEQNESNVETTFLPPDEVEVRYTPAKPPVSYRRGGRSGQ